MSSDYLSGTIGDVQLTMRAQCRWLCR